ncbi:shikimate kinase [Lapidilactobacillus wuchangensis]|uniref:shikimate kinase n=1 Tax=Lapidilactobacillus wuchangensis TaxID=2486001 RepID=UPI000F7B29AB|nr:shikimate kinase [Lapidilactobacillus wuchangensis]
MTVILMGFMGVGKTTTAQVLAQEYQLTQLDNDQFLCQREQATVAELFHQYGEAGFRQRELQACQAAMQQQPQILALGGGMVEAAASREFLQQQAPVLWLKSDFATCWQRIQHDQGRPLVQQLQQAGLAQRFERRQAWYQAVATDVIEVAQQTPHDLAGEIYHRYFK